LVFFGKPLTKAYQIKKENLSKKETARQLKVCRISGTHPLFDETGVITTTYTAATEGKDETIYVWDTAGNLATVWR
jgi:hypothetical protein